MLILLFTCVEQLIRVNFYYWNVSSPSGFVHFNHPNQQERSFLMVESAFYMPFECRLKIILSFRTRMPQ